MTFANRHNHGNKFTFRQEKDAPYIKAAELFKRGVNSEQTAVRVRGLYINRGGRFGDSPAMICDGFNVNLPSHMLREVEDMIASDEDVADINAGKAGAFAYEYENRNGSTSYGIAWVDMPALDIAADDLPY